MYGLSVLLLWAAAASAPTEAVGVVVLRRADVSSATASSCAAQLRERLAKKATLEGKRALSEARLLSDDRADPCAGEEDCPRAVGSRLGLTTIVSVDLAGSRKAYALHLEAVVIASGSRLATADLVVPRDKLSQPLGPAFDAFVAQVVARFSATASDVPRKNTEPSIAPRPRPEAEPIPIAVARSGEGSRRAAVWGCGGGAIAAGLIAIGLSVGSTVEGGKLDANAAGLVSMPYSQAQPTASRANGMLGAGVGLGVAAIALATAAIVLHLSSPEPSPP